MNKQLQPFIAKTTQLSIQASVEQQASQQESVPMTRLMQSHLGTARISNTDKASTTASKGKLGPSRIHAGAVVQHNILRHGFLVTDTLLLHTCTWARTMIVVVDSRCLLVPPLGTAFHWRQELLLDRI